MNEDWKLWGFNPCDFKKRTLQGKKDAALLVVNRTNSLLIRGLITVVEYAAFIKEIARRIEMAEMPQGDDTDG